MQIVCIGLTFNFTALLAIFADQMPRRIAVATEFWSIIPGVVTGAADLPAVERTLKQCTLTPKPLSASPF